METETAETRGEGGGTMISNFENAEISGVPYEQWKLEHMSRKELLAEITRLRERLKIATEALKEFGKTIDRYRRSGIA